MVYIYIFDIDFVFARRFVFGLAINIVTGTHVSLVL